MLNCFKKISIYDPAEMLDNDVIENDNVIVISQSGETKDLINKITNFKKI